MKKANQGWKSKYTEFLYLGSWHFCSWTDGTSCCWFKDVVSRPVPTGLGIPQQLQRTSRLKKALKKSEMSSCWPFSEFSGDLQLSWAGEGWQKLRHEQSLPVPHSLCCCPTATSMSLRHSNFPERTPEHSWAMPRALPHPQLPRRAQTPPVLSPDLPPLPQLCPAQTPCSVPQVLQKLCPLPFITFSVSAPEYLGKQARIWIEQLDTPAPC